MPKKIIIIIIVNRMILRIIFFAYTVSDMCPDR